MSVRPNVHYPSNDVQWNNEQKSLVTFTLSQQGQWLRKCAREFLSFFIQTTKIKIVFLMLNLGKIGEPLRLEATK